MLLEHLQDEAYGRLPLGYGGKFYGVYPAVVSNLSNPDLPGWVEIQLPWCPDTDGTPFTAWARLASPMAGNLRGIWFYPDVQDEVLVCFEAGNPRKPYIMGALWNGVDATPETMDTDSKNEIKSITTRSGIKITFDDTDKKEKMAFQTPGGHVVTLQDDGENSAPTVTITDSNGNTMAMTKDGMKFTDKNTNTITQNADGMEFKDKNSNVVTQNGDGISATDKNGNTVKLDSSGIALTDKNNSTVTMSGGNLEAKNQAGQSVAIGASDVTTKDTMGNSVKVGPDGITTKDGILGNSVKVGADGITVKDGILGNTIKVAASGITVQAIPLGMLKVAPDGVTLQSGPTILKVGPDGLSVTALRISLKGLQVELVAPMVSATTAMLQVAGVLQASTIIAPAVSAGAYTPGGGNIL